MSKKKLLIETWLDPDPDDRITTHDLYCAAMEATERIEELEAENKQLRLDAHTQQAFYGGRIEELEAEKADLRKLIKREQELRKNYHNEETVRLRDVLRYIRENSSCGVARQWAKKALKANTTVDDPVQELTNI